ncbi:MAG: class I SAM-dependent methyltransferase [Nitriliruptorales bacterium]|nr:class I SAM-dependent methyltransferase [Nitriliruptorales bacterium]
MSERQHYGLEARFYDALYASGGRDVEAEIGRLDAVLAELGVEPASLLDVACGTGIHLEAWVRRGLDVVGVDLSPEMLQQAERRLPDAELLRADFRDFDLGRTFDAVTCLFSAIGHVDDEAELDAAVAAMVRHVAPGGALLIEPWLTPDRLKPDGVRDVLCATVDDVAVSRVARSRPAGDGLHIEYGYTIATRDGIEFERIGMDLPTFTRERHLAAVERAGLDASWVEDHGFGERRGLLVGRRSGR